MSQRIHLVATGLVVAALLVAGCSNDPEGLKVEADVQPKSIEKKVGEDLEITVTAKSSTDKVQVEMTIAHNPTGIITGGVVSDLSGVFNLKAAGLKYTYEVSPSNEGKTKVTFTCGKVGETTLSFKADFDAELAPDLHEKMSIGPMEVKVKCTGDPLEEFAKFMLQLGLPQTTINWANARVGNMIKHSSGSVATVKALPDMLKMVALSSALTPTLVKAAFGNTTFPCGKGAAGHTICHPSKKAFPAGDVIIVAHEADRAIELADSKYTYQYGFVFDSDGDKSNNYQPAPAYPNDFFKDSDLWYEANYTPSGGWTLKVTDAKGGTTKVIDSAAKVVMLNKTAVLVVPASELGVAKPSYRVEIFRHTGDYGINPPHDWSGDVEPPVDQGLKTFD